MCQMYVILMSFKNTKIRQVGLTSRYETDVFSFDTLCCASKWFANRELYLIRA